MSGLGGAGKTQTAVEYAHRHADEYTDIFWTSAASREAVIAGYVAIARMLQLPEAAENEQMLAVAAVKRVLASRKGWLLILDNADDIQMVRPFLPDTNGHLLLTTRAWALGAVARVVEIKEMSGDEGALFLLRRTRTIGEKATFVDASETDQELAKQIARDLLDGLPLALDQAGAFIEETGCGLAGYLSLYRKRGSELLKRRGALATEHPDPVATAWDLSFEKIENANKAAADLLRLCAFLDPDAIPEELFKGTALELGEGLAAVAADELALNEAIAEILKYSLLRRDSDTKTLEMHRLVQAVFRQRMGEVEQGVWAERAVRVAERAFPIGEFESWATCERLLAQALACAEIVKNRRIELDEAAQLLNNTGFYLDARGRYGDAEPLYQRSGAIWEKTLGPEHSNVATSLGNLAELYRKMGEYGKAETLNKQSLAIAEKVLGPDDPGVATSLNNLALIYRNLGEFEKAEPLYLRSGAILEKALGAEHPDVATSLNNLGALYIARGDYDKAEPLSKRALVIREKVLSPQHPDVAQSLNNLAMMYEGRGAFETAESMYKRALAIWEKALGPEDPGVATCLENYAYLLEATGQTEKAKQLADRADKITKKMAQGGGGS